MLSIKTTLFALLLSLLSALSFAAVNINTATEAELTALPGIGAGKAKAIVEYRQKNGPFKSVDELTKVPGIKEKTLEKFKGEVTLSGVAQKAAKPLIPAKK